MFNMINNFKEIHILLLFAMLPSFIIGFIIYKKDVIEKEPFFLLLKLFLCGILAVGVSLFLEIYAEKIFPFANNQNIIGILFKSFIVIAVCEEFVKWLFTYVICWRKREFNYVYDAIVYSVFISLGFATIENIISVLSSEADFMLAFKRGIITVPVHAFFGIISGYYLGLAKKYENRGWKRRYKKSLLLSILMPILCHGIFDGLLFLSNKLSIILVFLLILYFYYSAYLKVTDVSKLTKKITRD